MDWKTIAEVEASFRPVERLLDAMLEESRATLAAEGIVLREDSNRTGFGGHSYPAFDWSFHFEKRWPFGSEIKRARVQLTYREPFSEEESRSMKVTSVAEIFQIGKQSRVLEARERHYPIDRFLDLRMDSIILECTAAAEQILSKK